MTKPGFFAWYEWRHGIGRCAGKTPRDPKLRPKGLPRIIPPAWWVRNLKLWHGVEPKPVPVPPPPVPPKPRPRPTPYPEKGADFVSGPTPAQDRAAGIKFVMRYISTAGNPKNITRAELASLKRGGIQAGLVFETTGKTFLRGYAAGVADAHLAQAQVTALGHPTAVVYFACDTDPHGHEAAIVAYMRGAASVLGHDRVGVYGGYPAVKACLDAGACKFAWQTYAWSYGVWDRRAHLRQVKNGVHIAGHGVDIDTALGAFGAV